MLIIETQASFIIQAIFKYYKWAHVQLNSKSPPLKFVPQFKLNVYIKNKKKNKQKRKKNLNSATVLDHGILSSLTLPQPLCLATLSWREAMLYVTAEQ